jgi:Spy/CpxP family protein refolding chaperone
MKRNVNFKLAGFVLLCSIFSLNLSAQGPGGPGGGPQMTEEDIKERAENTAQTLGLTEDQHKKILAIDMDFYNKMQIERQKMANMERTEENREAMRAKMMKMRDDRNKQYEDVLTPEQYEKFLEIQEQRRNEMEQKRQQNNPEGAQQEQPQRGRGRN